jgi:molybdenum cofactor guanylyltransferase
MSSKTPPAVAVLLAGGLARRMGGGDKCLRLLGGKTLLARAIDTIRPQVSALVLNANGDAARFAGFGLPVIADVVQGYAGPLAGVLSGMEWAKEHAPGAEWLLSVPTDSPFLPADLAARLVGAAVAKGAPLACAASGGQAHPVVGAWRVELAAELRRALVQDGVRKIDAWTARYNLAVAEWPVAPVDPFFNANSPEELEAAEALVRTGSRG